MMDDLFECVVVIGLVAGIVVVSCCGGLYYFCCRSKDPKTSKNVPIQQVQQVQKIQPPTFYVPEPSCRLTVLPHPEDLQPVAQPEPEMVADVQDETMTREFPAVISHVTEHNVESPPHYPVKTSKEDLPPPYSLIAPSAFIITEVCKFILNVLIIIIDIIYLSYVIFSYSVLNLQNEKDCAFSR